MSRNTTPPPENGGNNNTPERSDHGQRRAPEAPGGGNVPRSRPNDEHSPYDRGQHGQWYSDDTLVDPDPQTEGY